MFSNYSVKKPYTVVVAVLIIIILGIISFTNISADLLPSMNLPYAVVVTTYIGGSPEEVEAAVTGPIEQRMASVSNIKEIRSISSENFSAVILEFNSSANMDSVVIEMRESLDMLKPYMPDQAGSPMIMKLNPDMMPVMVISAAVKGQDIAESSAFIESTIIPELESVEGVASVSASGLLEKYINVMIRDDRIQAINEGIRRALSAAGYGESQLPAVSITAETVSGILKGQNFSMPAGYITEDGIDYLVRAGNSITDMEELKDLVIMPLPVPGADSIRLKDVADIFLLDNSKDIYSKVNGSDAVILTMQKQTEYGTADVSKRVNARIGEIMGRQKDTEIVKLMDQGEYIGIVVNSLSLNLILGGILAILILLLLLRDLKPTLIVGFAIPVSLVTAFVMMYFGKVTLNIISMGGLALGVGMLVDNSIVVIENIYRMRSEGKSPKEAAVEGAKQVTGAIVASTLTTVAVFVPILFTQGITRQIFSDMGLTIAFSLLASLIVAMTLVPMMASGLLIRNINKDHRIFEAVKKRYLSILQASLKHKWVVLLTVLILFAGSVAGTFIMGTELFPAADSGQLSVNLTMPPGTAREDARAAADKVAGIIMDIDDVETVGAMTGGGMFGFAGMGFGRETAGQISFYVTLRDSREMTTDRVAQLIRETALSTEYEITAESTSMDISALSGGTIVIDIKGRELDTLKLIAEDIAGIVASVEGTADVSDGLEDTEPEIRISVDSGKSIEKGLTAAQVYLQIRELLSDEPAATVITVGAKDYEIFVLDGKDKKSVTISDIAGLSISSPLGEDVRLTDIAAIEEASGFMSISRTGQQRYVTVSAELAEGYNVGMVSGEISRRIELYTAPEGYSVEMGGERRMIGETFGDLYLMLGLAVVLIYLIMVAQFQSLLSPFIIMFTIPLAFTGGFLGLLSAGMPISAVALVGMIVLAGVVVNNGIVFVDYLNKMREAGMNIKDAIMKAGNDRIRPILMTALTTIFALSTLAAGAGENTEMLQPMAVTAVGGLIYATLLTLVLVPVLYDVFHKEDRSDLKKEKADSREGSRL